MLAMPVLSPLRSQVAPGDVLVRQVALGLVEPEPRQRKYNFADKCVPKRNLRTREQRKPQHHRSAAHTMLPLDCRATIPAAVKKSSPGNGDRRPTILNPGRRTSLSSALASLGISEANR